MKWWFCEFFPWVLDLRKGRRDYGDGEEEGEMDAFEFMHDG